MSPYVESSLTDERRSIDPWHKTIVFLQIVIPILIGLFGAYQAALTMGFLASVFYGVLSLAAGLILQGVMTVFFILLGVNSSKQYKIVALSLNFTQVFILLLMWGLIARNVISMGNLLFGLLFGILIALASLVIAIMGRLSSVSKP